MKFKTRSFWEQNSIFAISMDVLVDCPGTYNLYIKVIIMMLLSSSLITTMPPSSRSNPHGCKSCGDHNMHVQVAGPSLEKKSPMDLKSELARCSVVKLLHIIKVPDKT